MNYQIFAVSAFIICLCLIALTDAVVFYSLKNKLYINSKIGVLWGAALVPFDIAFFMLLLSFIPTPAPQITKPLIIVAGHLAVLIVLRNKAAELFRLVLSWIDKVFYIYFFDGHDEFYDTELFKACMFSNILFFFENLILEPVGGIIGNVIPVGIMLCTFNILPFFIFKIRLSKISEKIAFATNAILPFLALLLMKISNNNTAMSKIPGALKTCLKQPIGIAIILIIVVVTTCIAVLIKKRISDIKRVIIWIWPMIFAIYPFIRDFFWIKRKVTSYLEIALCLLVLSLLFFIKKKPLDMKIFVVPVLILLIIRVSSSLMVSVNGSDATEYMSYALRFTGTMKFQDIINFNGDNSGGGGFIPMVHHPGWVLYLAFAMCFSFSDKIGYPNDYPVRAAFEITIILLLISIIALSVRVNAGKILALSVVLPFIQTSLKELHTSQSRDAFRIIPILILIGLLLGYSKNKKVTKEFAVFTIFLVMDVMVGHTLNAIQLVIIVVAFFLWWLINRVCFENLLKIGICVITGAALGAYNIIWAYLVTGSMYGNSYSMIKLLAGTKYGENFANYQAGRMKGTDTYIDRLQFFLIENDTGLVVILSLLCAACILIMHKRIRTNKRLIPFAFIAILQCLAFTDVVSWDGMKLSEWSVANVRYTLQIYVIAGIFVGAIIERILMQKSLRIKTLAYGLSIVFVALSAWTVHSEWKTRRVYDDSIDLLCHEAAGYINDENVLLLDNYFTNYLFDNEGILFHTDYTEDIRLARDEDEIEEALSAKGVKTVMFMKSLISVYYDDTPLLNYVTKNGDILMDNASFTLYRVN